MLFDVEVHVGGVERVGARTQDGREPAASHRPHNNQKVDRKKLLLS
jgi:hypothetical protein